MRLLLVKQAMLADIQDKRTLLNRMGKEVEVLRVDLEKLEDQVIEAIEGGASIEYGPLVAGINITERRNVSWKDVATRLLGPATVARVLAETLPTTYKKLAILVGGTMKR